MRRRRGRVHASAVGPGRFLRLPTGGSSRRGRPEATDLRYAGAEAARLVDRSRGQVALIGLLLLAMLFPNLPQFERKAMTGRAFTYPRLGRRRARDRLALASVETRGHLTSAERP